MGYKVTLQLEKDGRKVQYATLTNISVIEQLSDDNQATFKFHVEGSEMETLGIKTKLVILDTDPAIQRVFSQPAEQQKQSAPKPAVMAPIPLGTGENNAENNTPPAKPA